MGKNIEDYLEDLKSDADKAAEFSDALAVPFKPKEPDLRIRHDMYVSNLLTCYMSKFSDLSTALINAVENENFLCYALCGRSIIENVATLRYFVLLKYDPLFKDGKDSVDLQALSQVDNRHLRGGRFDWMTFRKKDYAKLCNDTAERLRNKKPPTKKASINVQTCIDKWAEENVKYRVVYDMFCDMVHPNVGSSVLIASHGPDGTYFAKDRGTSTGERFLGRLCRGSCKPHENPSGNT
jgi:hypothetical protein